MSEELIDGKATAHTWVIKDNCISLACPNGKFRKVTARDVIRAEFKGRTDVQDMQVINIPSHDLPAIHIHRFPLKLKLEVDLSNHNSVIEPVLKLKAFNADYLFDINEIPDGQLITQEGWFSVDEYDQESIQKILLDASIECFGRISLRMYLDLMKSERDIVFFNAFDESSGETPSALEEEYIPSSFIGTLYPYQKEGVAWLRSISREGLGCILADEMGLGKTVQVIVLILIHLEEAGSNSLIIAPTTLLENWRREFQKFAPTIRTVIHRGAGRTGFPSKLKSSDVILTSYETAVRDLSLLKMLEWDLVVLDEAQAIKNSRTQRAVAIKEIGCKMGVAVTGTPFENSMNDIWSIMDFVCAGLLGNEKEFELKYVNSIDSALSLEPIISPLILRRLVKDVAKDLPARIDIPQAVSLSSEAASEYDAIRKEIMAEYGAGASLVALLKLRMYCVHPFLVNDVTGDPAVFSTKYQRLVEILNEIFSVSQKVIIFTSYTKMSDLLARDLSSRFSIKCDMVDGRTPVIDRQSVVDKFQSIGGSAVLILNPRAAGTGLNITAANHVIHYNLEWNPAIEDQASARSFRRGQKNPVTIHRLYHPGTVEEIIDERVTYKRGLAAAAIVGTDGDKVGLTDVARALQISPLKNSEGVP